MADGRELDFFDIFVFDRDEEAGGQQSEPQEEQPPEPPEEDIPLIDLTADSDDNGAGNSTPAVVQQEQQPRRRQARRAQTCRMREPATDSEDSSDDEASSSSKRQSVKTGARKSNVHSLEIITFSQLEQKDKDAAQRVLDYYRDERERCCVQVCSRFMSGKCRYMSKYSRDLFKHMKSRHPNEKHSWYKITQYPGFKDCKTNDFVSKPYAELKQTDLQLAEEVLALYKRPQNENKRVHLCGHFSRGKCQYFSISTSGVKMHMARKHSRTLPMIKIVGYPGERERTHHEYEQVTYVELKSMRSNVADEVLKYYYENNFRGKVHLCGSCDHFSKDARHVRDHVARYHSPTTRVYKIIEYPPLALD